LEVVVVTEAKSGAVVLQQAVPPKGPKLWILQLGQTEGDAAWFIQGANNSTVSQPRPVHERLRISMMAALIEHPRHGLLLYDVGSAPDPAAWWGPDFCDAFPWVEYDEEHRLDRAIAMTGHDINEVSAIIISHLHLDHAGGLEYFRGRDVPVYVHRQELEHAFYAVASRQDIGNYQAHYLDFAFKWEPLSGDSVELFDGLTLYRTPGHTPGLMGLLLELPASGAFYFASDHLSFRENFTDDRPPGWLMRDHDAWHESTRRIRRLVQARDATVVYGHDPVIFESVAPAPSVHQ
jgi:glyoxylase-like metal-dependent hydrolase (beta-lactamase superfamily II)